MGDLDTHVTCPYNRAHSILRERMQFHLTRCRAQYFSGELVSCTFNSVHVVPKIEIELHEEMCKNRIVIDNFLFNGGAQSACPANNTVPINAVDLPPCEENWDDVGEKVSVLDAVKEKAKDKGVLLNLIGAPKAERKAHRMQERQRFQRVMEGQHKAHAERSTSSKTSATDGLPNGVTNGVRMPVGRGKNRGKKTTSETSERNNSGYKTTARSPVSNKRTEENFSKVNSKSENENYESTKPIGPVKIESKSKQVSSPQVNSVAKTGNPWNRGNACNGFNATETNTDFTTPALDGWNKVVHKPRNFPASSDFPMLPVSGLGRGRRRNGKF